MAIKIDAHQHFWKYDSNQFGWIGDNMEVLKNDFLPGDLGPLLQGIGFDGSIAVQARQSLEETRWLLNLAGKYEFIKGVVGWVDLRSPEVEAQLKEFSTHEKLVGVRHVVQSEPDEFMKDKAFLHGIGLLQKYNLTYDFLLFPKHLPLATEVSIQFPEQKFVLDHLSKPFIKDQIKSPWNLDIKALSSNSNVYCKLSGMVTEADWQSWEPRDFHFYIDTIIDCFGPDRVMIGSDWPVCTVAGNYQKVMSIVVDRIQKYDDSSIQDKILGETCNMFYLS